MNITKISQRTTTQAAKILSDYWKERGMQYTPKWALAYIKKGHKSEIKKDQFFVAKEGPDVVGTASIIIYEGDVAELRDLVVKKSCRKQGCGSALMDAASKFCKEQKVRKMYGLTFPQQQQFMKKRGYKKEGVLKNHFKKGEDLVIMSKFLRS